MGKSFDEVGEVVVVVFGEFGVEEDYFGVEFVGDGGVGLVSGEGVFFGEDVLLVVGVSF